jgi:DNA-directed RNA polymerase subunit RPC12/RpoP
MVKYICFKCSKIFDRKSNYTYHIENVNCNKNKNGNKIKCEYCDIFINKVNFKRHQINNCKFIPLDIKNNLIEKHNNRKNTKNKIRKNNISKTDEIKFNKKNILNNKYFNDLNKIGEENINIIDLTDIDVKGLKRSLFSLNNSLLLTIINPVRMCFNILNKYPFNKNCIIKNISYLTIYGKFNYNELSISTIDKLIQLKIISSTNFLCKLMNEYEDEIKENRCGIFNQEDIEETLNKINEKKFLKNSEYKKLYNYIKSYYINNNDKFKENFNKKLKVL